ncbi:hypothetical protein [Allocoleopsis franciscana]|uniref:hypothetical protein n=1 Tax=Allocoleopsis franciscana TaxID=2886352 RepID=UPI001C11C5F1|nr:hypothetical protein [Allocoleopsis franciscana]
MTNLNDVMFEIGLLPKSILNIRQKADGRRDKNFHSLVVCDRTHDDYGRILGG